MNETADYSLSSTEVVWFSPDWVLVSAVRWTNVQTTLCADGTRHDPHSKGSPSFLLPLHIFTREGAGSQSKVKNQLKTAQLLSVAAANPSIISAAALFALNGCHVCCCCHHYFRNDFTAYESNFASFILKITEALPPETPPTPLFCYFKTKGGRFLRLY